MNQRRLKPFDYGNLGPSMIFCLTIRTKGFMRVGGVREWPKFVSQDWIRRSKNSPFVTNKLDILRIKKKKKQGEKRKRKTRRS
jgi:hypothetical protein